MFVCPGQRACTSLYNTHVHKYKISSYDKNTVYGINYSDTKFKLAGCHGSARFIWRLDEVCPMKIRVCY